MMHVEYSTTSDVYEFKDICVYSNDRKMFQLYDVFTFCVCGLYETFRSIEMRRSVCCGCNKKRFEEIEYENVDKQL